MMPLFPDEQVITRSNDNTVKLTTHRIFYEYDQGGHSFYQSIALEHVTSCESYSISYNWLLMPVILFMVLTGFMAYQDVEEVATISGALAIGFLILYFLTRHHFIIISSPSTKIKIRGSRIHRDRVMSFINDIEYAKSEKLLRVKNI